MNEKEKAKYKLPLQESYSEAFKRKVVMEIENGMLSKDGAKYRYGISGNSRVWIGVGNTVGCGIP